MRKTIKQLNDYCQKHKRNIKVSKGMFKGYGTDFLSNSYKLGFNLCIQGAKEIKKINPLLYNELIEKMSIKGIYEKFI